jgi:hypothetical protein
VAVVAFISQPGIAVGELLPTSIFDDMAASRHRLDCPPCLRPTARGFDTDIFFHVHGFNAMVLPGLLLDALSHKMSEQELRVIPVVTVSSRHSGE